MDIKLFEEKWLTVLDPVLLPDRARERDKPLHEVDLFDKFLVLVGVGDRRPGGEMHRFLARQVAVDLLRDDRGDRGEEFGQVDQHVVERVVSRRLVRRVTRRPEALARAADALITGIIQVLSLPPLRQRSENKKQMSNNLKIGD